MIGHTARREEEHRWLARTARRHGPGVRELAARLASRRALDYVSATHAVSLTASMLPHS